MSTVPQRRKRIFGPLTYGMLALGAVALVSSSLINVAVWVRGWMETNSLIEQARGGREDATRELAQRIGPGPALSYVFEAVHHPLTGVRASACRTLVAVAAANEPSRVVSALADLATDPQEAVRLEAARGLARIPANPRYRNGASASSPRWVTSGVPAEALRILEVLRTDPAPAVRMAAIEALPSFLREPPPQALYVRTGLGNPAPSAPRPSLEQPPGPAILASLRAATRDTDPNVRLTAARMLQNVNGPGDTDVSRAALDLLADPDPDVERSKLVELLAHADEEVQGRAVSELVKVLEWRDPTSLADAIEALAAFGDRARPALPILERLRADQEPMMRVLSGRAIVAIEGPRTPRGTSALVGMIVDASLPEEARFEALERAREVGPNGVGPDLARATPALIRQLADPAVEVRLRAHNLLSMILETTPARLPAADGSN
jgi:HEAT repeat protein